MPTKAPTKNLGANIPLADYEEFKDNCPGYGGTQYFIEEAVRAFNARCRENPSLREQVKLSIDDMLQRNREARA